jgi:hypothetical protein
MDPDELLFRILGGKEAAYAWLVENRDRLMKQLEPATAANQGRQ